MKKLALLVCLFGVGWSFSNANAQAANSSTAEYSTINNVNKTGQVGVGLQFGSLSGVDLEYWTNDDRAWNGGIAADNGNPQFSLSYLWMFRDVFSGPIPAKYFVPYIGIGGVLGFGTNSDEFNRTWQNSSNTALAAQLPLGLEFLPHRQRFSIFAEVAPSVEITPYGTTFLTADLGAKLYF